MKILFDLSTSPYISTLGWTILHSLWQAALLGMVASLGFYLLRRRSAQSRYSLGVGVLGTQILASVATYFYYLPSSLEKTTSTVLTNYQFVGSSANMSASGTAPLPLLVQIQLWLAVHLNELVICWLIGVSILLLRFAGGWFYLERLRFVSRPVKDRVWQTRFGVLVARLDIGRAVEFRETARIVTPMVVGVLRPVVLVPVGLLAGLSVAQVEAILAHELAHIRRHDYLVNLVQSFVEVVYFFHPALWWLSGRIRAEREHCCDDLAMAVCDDRLSLAHALVRVAEFRAEPALVVAFAANKRQLLSRVRRVLGVAEPASRRFAGYLPMAVVLISLSVGASVYAFQKEKLEDKRQQSGANVEKGREAVANTDTLIEREVEVLIDEKVDVETNLELAMQHEEPLFLVEGESVKVYGPNGEGPIHISGQGTVRTVNENDTLQKKLAEYHAKMETLQKEMQPYQEEAKNIQEQMQLLHRRMSDLHLVREKGQLRIEETQREGEKIEWKKNKITEERQQLVGKRSELMHSKNNLSVNDQDKKLAELESQIKAKDQEIDGLIDQLLKNSKILGEAGKPLIVMENGMEKIGREAEVYDRKMEEISKKMEVISRKMEEEARQIEKLTSSTSRDGWGTTTIRSKAFIPSTGGWGTTTIRGNGTTTTATRSRSYPANPASPARPPKAPAPAPSAKSIPAAPAVAPVSKVLAAPTVPAAPPKKK